MLTVISTEALGDSTKKVRADLRQPARRLETAFDLQGDSTTAPDVDQSRSQVRTDAAGAADPHVPERGLQRSAARSRSGCPALSHRRTRYVVTPSVIKDAANHASVHCNFDAKRATSMGGCKTKSACLCCPIPSPRRWPTCEAVLVAERDLPDAPGYQRQKRSRSVRSTGHRGDLKKGRCRQCGRVVGVTGLEPVTPSLSSWCSSQLS